MEGAWVNVSVVGGKRREDRAFLSRDVAAPIFDIFQTEAADPRGPSVR